MTPEENRAEAERLLASLTKPMTSAPVEDMSVVEMMVYLSITAQSAVAHALLATVPSQPVAVPADSPISVGDTVWAQSRIDAIDEHDPDLPYRLESGGWVSADEVQRRTP